MVGRKEVFDVDFKTKVKAIFLHSFNISFSLFYFLPSQTLSHPFYFFKSFIHLYHFASFTIVCPYGEVVIFTY